MRAETAIVFAGLPDSYESEGFDRASLDMPLGHKQLIEAVASVQPNVAVVLMNGSAVTMPWAGKVKAILEGLARRPGRRRRYRRCSHRGGKPVGKTCRNFPKQHLRYSDVPLFPREK